MRQKQISLSLALLPTLLLVMLLAGCRTSRNTADTAKKARQQTYEQLAPLARPQSDMTTLTAKAVAALDYNGHTINVKGRLRMRRDEVIQVTITALGVVEIAFIEFTQQGVYIIDRVNKRYALLDYSSKLLQGVGVNFSTIQSLFWNRLFIPGKEQVWNHLDDFRITTTENAQLIEPESSMLLKCQFYTDKAFTRLQQTDLALRHYKATWRYDMFSTIDSHSYPLDFDISLSGSSRTIGAHITLNNVSTTDTAWKSGTNLGNYKKVEFEQLLSILNFLQ